MAMSTRTFRENFTMVPRVYFQLKSEVEDWLPLWISPNGMGITRDELILTALYCLSGRAHDNFDTHIFGIYSAAQSWVS